MKRLPLIFLMFFVINCYGQETKFIKRDVDRLVSEEYYVLKDNKDIKHGTYVKYLVFGGKVAVIQSGNYLNGEKDGIWETYFYEPLAYNYNNHLKEKGAYFNGKKNGVWTYYYPENKETNLVIEETSNNKKNVDLNISINSNDFKLKKAGMFLNDKPIGEWTLFSKEGNVIQKCDFTKNILIYDVSIKDTIQSLNRKPMYFGGNSDLFDKLGENIDLPNFTKHIATRDSTFVIAEFTVDLLGKINNLSVSSNSKNKSIIDEFTKAFLFTDKGWVCGVKEGKKEELFCKVRIDFIRINVKSNGAEWIMKYIE